MGIFLKYMFYLMLIIVVYFIGSGIYKGDINSTTTVGDVVEKVDSNAKTMVETVDAKVEKTMDEKSPE